MSNYTIPVYKPSLSDNVKKYVNECIDSTWISSRGAFIPKFEGGFKDFLGVASATSVSNGTVALHLALLGLGIGPGDEVIVPTLTYVASVNAITYVGATPVFIDADKSSWNIDTAQIEEKITHKTKAIMAVHLYGNPCDMEALGEICKKHAIFLIEDAAEAFGSKLHDQYLGTFGDVATFSFFGNKTLTTGEGGMVVSNNSNLINKIAHLKNQGVSKDKEYWHDVVGYNYRMTNICSAIGVAQLENIELIFRKKREIAAWYKTELNDVPVIFQKEMAGTINSFWIVSVLFDSKLERDVARQYLNEKGIETRPIFYPAHVLPIYQNNQTYPVSEFISERGVNLPSYPDLTREDVSRICKHIRHAVLSLCSETLS